MLYKVNVNLVSDDLDGVENFADIVRTLLAATHHDAFSVEVFELDNNNVVVLK